MGNVFLRGRFVLSLFAGTIFSCSGSDAKKILFSIIFHSYESIRLGSITDLEFITQARNGHFLITLLILSCYWVRQI